VAQLAELRRQDVEDPGMLWLNCYRVLCANQDARAGAVLDQAYKIVQERALRISDPAMRRTFLHIIAVNAQIVEEWQAVEAVRTQASRLVAEQPVRTGLVGPNWLPGMSAPPSVLVEVSAYAAG
jgi:hypothetical protein